jgi:Zn-dependent protease
MLNLLLTSPFAFVFAAAALLLVITVHEFAHAWMAERLGDPTARLMGRLTLNPLAHLDPLGTLGLLLLGFGWGKPVPFDPYNLANPRQDGALISLAGPASNLLLATVLAVFYRSPLFLPLLPTLLGQILYLVIYWSIALAIFNLLPIYPLDGEKIFAGILPEELAERWSALVHQYGLFLLIFLIFPFAGGSLLSLIISPLIQAVLHLLLPGRSGF